jgi:hypothetical protein
MRDHGKARRRPKQGKKPVDTSPVSEGPKLTIVASADPEYYNSVQLVKAAHRMQCDIPGCTERATAPFPRAMTQEENRHYCDHHAQVAELSKNQSSRLSRFSAGRIDPFVRYPIEMTSRDRRLLDHGGSSRDAKRGRLLANF